jgi:hypothetical protein
MRGVLLLDVVEGDAVPAETVPIVAAELAATGVSVPGSRG